MQQNIRQDRGQKRRLWRRWVTACILGSCTSPGCLAERGELVVANGPDVQLLDPQRATSSPDGRVLNALYSGLTRLNPTTLEPEPALAESFRSLQGGRQWRFRLRPELAWSDGSALTMEDVVQSWLRLLDPKTGAAYGEWLHALTGYEEWVRDGRQGHPEGLRVHENQLEVEFRHPVPVFASMCAFHALMPVAASLRAGRPGPHPTSGAFRLLERRVRDRLRLIRNPHAWNAHEVHLQSMDFLTVESQFTALNLFLAGEVHIVATDVPALALPALQRREQERRQAAREQGREAPPTEFEPAPFWGTYFYRINTTHPALADARTRRALSLAVNRQQLADAIGAGRPAAFSFVPPQLSTYAPPRAASFDPQAAQELLAAAGYPHGKGFPTIELLYNSAEIHRDVAETLQDHWRRYLNVEVRLYNQEWKVVLDAQNRLQYDLSRSSWVGDYLDPATFLEVFRSTSAHNRCGWKDTDYDALLDRARIATDSSERTRLYQEAEKRLLQQAPIIPLFHYTTLDLVSSEVRGYVRNPRSYVDWGRLSLAKER